MTSSWRHWAGRGTTTSTCGCSCRRHGARTGSAPRDGASWPTPESSRRAGATGVVAREPDPDHVAPGGDGVALPAAAGPPTPRRRRVRRHGMQIAAPLPGVRRAVRVLQGACDAMTSPSTFHPARRSPTSPTVRTTPWRSRSTCPAELADEFAFRPGQSVTVRRMVDGHGAAPVVFDLRACRGAAVDRRPGGSRRGGVDVAGAWRSSRATASRCSVRAERSRPTSSRRPTTC